MSGPSPATSARASAEIPLCQPPDPAPRKPRLICPPGTADCHVHVYGPADRYPVAIAELAGYLKDGRMKSKEDIVQGLDTFPEALNRLFSGANFGKLVLQVATE